MIHFINCVFPVCVSKQTKFKFQEIYFSFPGEEDLEANSNQLARCSDVFQVLILHYVRWNSHGFDAGTVFWRLEAEDHSSEGFLQGVFQALPACSRRPKDSPALYEVLLLV